MNKNKKFYGQVDNLTGKKVNTFKYNEFKRTDSPTLRGKFSIPNQSPKRKRFNVDEDGLPSVYIT
tara:strand:- start:80 stop:274 length:195 start_codon:yes stop_codon:yes gene_type:complete